jgi:hypothetical protein
MRNVECRWTGREGFFNPNCSFLMRYLPLPVPERSTSTTDDHGLTRIERRCGSTFFSLRKPLNGDSNARGEMLGFRGKILPPCSSVVSLCVVSAVGEGWGEGNFMGKLLAPALFQLRLE